MKHSIAMLACAGVFLSASHHFTQAQSPGGALQNAASDGIDASRGGGYMSSFKPPSPRPPTTPGRVAILGARMLNGRIRFTFGASYPQNTMKYNILWSRPGKEETDMRWSTGRATEEYIINEVPLPDTTYFFVVQAQGKNKDYAGKYDLSNKEWSSFRTPPLQPRAAFQGKLTDMVAPAKKTNPLEVPRVDARIRLKPVPIIGR